jgi:PTS system mannose-specific IID component
MGFCIEPALRRLPGGVNGDAYRAALARQSQYFNAHPYLAAVAVGALARAELDGESPDRIVRFRTALCGPLGSVGDRLIWATFLPGCTFAALVAFGLGASPLVVLAVFLGIYNLGHLALRIWGLETGIRRGLRVATSLGTPALRQSPLQLGRAAALLGGFALPLAAARIVLPHGTLLWVVLVAMLGGGALLGGMHGRLEGWKVSMLVLALFVLFAVTR